MGGPDDSEKKQQQDITKQQVALAQSQDARGQKLFDTTFPGMEKAEDYYKQLASGDPMAIQRAIAPATQQITAASDAAKENIQSNMPRGGEQRLAMENTEIAKSSQIGRLTTQAYTSSFPALASLAGTGIGLSANEVANAIAAFGGAGQTAGNLANQEAAGKASTMGFVGSMVGAGATAAAACWIAMLLYGADSWKVGILRQWLAEEFSKTVIGGISWWAYKKFGRSAAAVLSRTTCGQMVVRPLFDRGLALAVNHYSWEVA